MPKMSKVSKMPKVKVMAYRLRVVQIVQVVQIVRAQVASSQNPERHRVQGSGRKEKNMVFYCPAPYALCRAPFINPQSKIYNLTSG
jgi:hypothetical protein